MKLPKQDETSALIRLAENADAMSLLHAFPRKVVKLLCQALKTEHEMRCARDRRILALKGELDKCSGRQAPKGGGE